ncbi:MAG: diaminopimelate epimerase [Peptococcaceae bacterium]|jgi:diaminopimelate epimerase|nr:diaminopimelate epimerase [Peptococcaceae bacterium]
MKFMKMHGLGNDFVMVNGFQEQLPEDISQLAVKMCHRRFGVGADGLILLLPSETDTLRMRIINSDGTEAEMCGNGIRCFALFAKEQGLVRENAFTVETLAGPIGIEIKGDNLVSVDMGRPVLEAADIPVVGEGRMIAQPIQLLDKEFRFTGVSMGNPHSVIFVEDVEHFPLATYGPVSEKHSFFPAKINTEFVQVLSRQKVRMRVWERGCGETMACGTGACATAVAAILNGLTDRTIDVVLDGGTLNITWDEITEKVFMTGEAAFVFTAEYLG